MNIGTILDETVDITFEYKDQPVSLTVRSEALTPEFVQALTDADKTPLDLAKSFAAMITAWDIDYNGEPWPPIFDNLKRLPMNWYAAALDKISEQWVGKAKTLKPSDNGSAPAVASQAATVQ